MNSNNASKNIVPLAQLNLTNDFLFGQVFSDPVIVKEFLEKLFGHSIPFIKAVKDQEVFIDSYQGKSARLDISVRDVVGNVYDIEVQSTMQKGLPKRVRIYHSHIDRNLLLRGCSYDKAPDVCVVFICNFDPFGYGDMVYEVGTNFRRWRNGPVPDGRIDYYLNINHTNQEQAAEMPEIAALLKYMGNSNGVDGACELTKLVSERTVAVKNDRDKEEAYMISELKEYFLREDCRAEGRTAYAEALKALGKLLAGEGKTEEFVKAATDEEYAISLFQHYNISY